MMAFPHLFVFIKLSTMSTYYWGRKHPFKNQTLLAIGEYRPQTLYLTATSTERAGPEGNSTDLQGLPPMKSNPRWD